MRSDEVLKPDIFSELILTLVGLAIFNTRGINSVDGDLSWVTCRASTTYKLHSDLFHRDYAFIDHRPGR